MNVTYILRSNNYSYSPTVRKIRQMFFKEVYEDGRFVKSLEIFWMNNKTIIEFGFRRMIYMKYYADLVGCYPPRST